MDLLSQREWIGGAIAAVWTAILAYLTFRRQSKTADDQTAAQVKSDTIAQWKVLYDQKCSDHEKLKLDDAKALEKVVKENGELKDRLTAEIIKNGDQVGNNRRLTRENAELREAMGKHGEGQT